MQQLVYKCWAHPIIKKNKKRVHLLQEMVVYRWLNVWLDPVDELGSKGWGKHWFPALIILGLWDWMIPLCIIHFLTDDKKKEEKKKTGITKQFQI